jgi:hypothetical protein
MRLSSGERFLVLKDFETISFGSTILHISRFGKIKSQYIYNVIGSILFLGDHWI